MDKAGSIVPDVYQRDFNHKKIILFFICTFIAFYLVKFLLLDRMLIQSVRYFSYFAVVISVIFLRNFDYKFWSKSSRIITKIVAILFGLYFLFSYPQLLKTDGLIIKFELSYWRWTAITSTILAIYRPAFLLVPIFYMAQMKGVHSELLHLSLSKTDYLPLLEAVFFIYVGAVIYTFAINKGSLIKENESNTIFDLLFLTTVAAHFSNYFYSAVKKIWISDGSITWWSFNNQTENLILTAYKSGHFPWPLSPESIQLIYAFMADWSWLSNSVLFIGQCLALIAITKLSWSKIVTVFYDMTHIAIFALTGIFFYKWIFYNFAIIWALSNVKNICFTPLLRIYLICVVIFAPLIFFVAKLGWFDNRSFNHEYFEAVYENGDKLEIPSNFFLTSSVTYAQQRIIRDKSEAHFPTGTFGVTFGINNVIRGNKCEYEVNNDIDLFIRMGAENVRKIRNRIERIQQYYIKSEAVNGKVLNYDFYPHHIFSFPWLFSDFKNRKKDTIVQYNYVVESYCLDMDINTEKDKLYRREVHQVYARP